MGVRNVATIGSPEFIEINSISPFVSKCEVKVFYLGENRNESVINKNAALLMAQTLPGCPIVGSYNETKEDFEDHGRQIVIDENGVHFKCKTVPYGFVAPDTKVWFQKFEETDDDGKVVIRDYLMTEAYLWTKQYEEAMKVYEEGRPHSMELDKNSMKGFWSSDKNRGIDFFIINDAIFEKLCILGEDVEPCFEGSAITAPKVSASFQLDKDFTNTLYNMMEELKELTFSLKEKGGNLMPTEKTEVQDTEEMNQTPAEFTEEEKNSENLGNDDSKVTPENHNTTEEFSKKEDEEKEDDSKVKNDSDDSNKESDDETDDKKESEDEEDKKKKNFALEEKFALLESELTELKSKYASLEQENYSLKQFKAEVENKEKDALINSFYMLSDEDKEDVIKNKANYTLDDIERTLSVICVRKKVDFSLGENKQEKEPVTTFNLNSLQEEESIPAWLKAVDNFKKENI